MAEKPCLTVIIPALNAARSLKATLDALAAGAALFDLEILVVDGGSQDKTVSISRQAGAICIQAPRGRGQQIAAGVRHSRGDWLIFLHADTHLNPGWEDEIFSFLKQPKAHKMGGYFRFTLDDDHPKALRLARIVAWRARVFGLPYGDQGFFIGRHYLQEVGGISEIPLMEDVDLVRRIGRRNLYGFKTRAITSAIRYQKGGYNRRACFHLFCLFLYWIGFPIAWIARIYR